MTYKITLDKFAKRCERLGGDLEQAALRGIRSAGERMVGVVVEKIGQPNREEGVEHGANDNGELSGSVRCDHLPDGALVSVKAPHAAWLEFGTRPHPVSNEGFQALMDWAYRKGLADSEEEAERFAFLLRESINAYGMQPRHYMARAVRAMKTRGILHDEVAKELAKLKGA